MSFTTLPSGPAPKRYVWVVEMQAGYRRKEWLPCAAAHLTRKDAKRAMTYEWKHNNPADTFRVVKYIASESK